MASVTTFREQRSNSYPTSDGRPMAETDWHRDLMGNLIDILEKYYVGDTMTYVSGNLLVYYVPGNKRRRVAPDVFVVKGVPKKKRPNYLLWEEGKGPDCVIEVTSSSTRKEDLEDKFHLYQDVLRVPDYFLFDPLGDYLDPLLQGYRLCRGRYRAIQPVQGRLPSKVLGLHLDPREDILRLYNPQNGRWLLPSTTGLIAQERAARQRERAARKRAEAEVERLRRELDALRRRLPAAP